MVGLPGAPTPRVVACTRRAVQAHGAPEAPRAARREGEGMSRRTVARRVELSGVGLHMGIECRLGFEPAAAGTGVRFRRSDRGDAEVPARVERAVLAERRTQLGEGAEAIHTVEHVLAAVAAREI